MKRKIQIALALAALTAVICCGTALADTAGMCGDNASWTFNTDTGVLTISGTGDMWNQGDEPGNRIWYSLIESITSVVINDGITSIGDYSFENHSSMTTLTIPDSVAGIGKYAFYGCESLSSLMIPDSVTTIGESAFAYCSGLADITIPEGVTSIDAFAFEDCSGMADVAVMNASTVFDMDVFKNCSADLVIRGWVNSTAHTYAKNNNIAFRSFSMETVLSGSGTADDPWLIESKDHWDTVALSVESGVGTAEQFFRLGADISVTTKIGTASNPFSGDFDGDGHTLTVTITGSDGYSSPFPYVSNTTFRNLKTGGTITVTGGRAGGLAGLAKGGCSIVNCAVATVITGTGGNEHAGFVSMCDGTGSVSVTGSVFTGTISDPDARFCAGFLGWQGTSVENCMYAGKMFTKDNSNDFIRTSDYKVNCYYTDSTGINRIKGVQALSVTADEGIALDFGDSTTYNVSGITAYPVGLVYDSTFWAGPDETVTLNISAAQMEGYTLRFTASSGTLEEADGMWRLTMSNQNVVISAVYEPLNGQCGDDVFWSYDQDTGVLTISGTGPMWDYDSAHPEDIGWDCRKENITSVVIGDSVTSIGNWAFSYQSEMTDTTIPDGMTAIGEGAFNRCFGLTDVTLPDSVQTIGDYAFANCAGLTGMTIPENVISVGHEAFSGCESLTDVTVMNASATFGDDVFADCPSDLVISGWGGSTAETYAGVNGITFYAFPYGKCGYNATWAFDIETGTLTISGTGYMDQHTQLNYTTRGWNRYIDDITSVVIEDGIISIGDYAFDGMSVISSLIIADSVQEIRQFAFLNCTGLTDVIIPDSVTEIVNSAFNGCEGLTSLTLSKNLTTLGSFAFARCPNLTSVQLPESLNTIQNGAFQNCTGLTGIILPDSVTYIGSTAFENCSGLMSLTLPKNLTYFGNSVFHGCSSLTSVAIPECITKISAGAFSGCTSMTDLTLPDTLTTITDSAFSNCTALTNVIVPKSVTEIDSSSFSECTALVSVTVMNAFVSFGSTDIFADHNDDLIIHGWAESTAQTYAEECGITFNAWPVNGSCGDGLSWTFDLLTDVMTISGTGPMSDYTSEQPGWHSIRSFITAVVIEEDVTAISSGAFRQCENMTDVTIPDSVTSIGKSAFQECIRLTEVVLPDSVTSLGGSAFRSCTSMTSVTIPAGVTSIGANAFKDCASELVLYGEAGSTAEAYAAYYSISFSAPPIVGSCGDEVTWSLNTASGTLTISGAGAMRDCSSSSYPDWYSYQNMISTVIIEEGVTEIGMYAFRNMTGVISVTIPCSVTSIGAYAFYKCAGLTGISIPGSVTSIGRQAFNGCTQLSEVILSDGLTLIGNNAFYGCTNLTGVVISESVTSIGYQAFQRCASLTAASILNPSASIGTKVFADCSEDLVIYGYDSSTAQTYAERYGILFESLIPKATFYLPAVLTAIGDDAFCSTNAVAVVIPNTVTSITGNPFADSNVTTIYGYAGSAAEDLANSYPSQFTFIPIDDDWMSSH